MTLNTSQRTTESVYRTKLALPVALLFSMGLLLVAGNLAGNGALEFIVTRQASPALEGGSLLRALVLRIANSFGVLLDPPTALVFISISGATLGAAMSYRMLRANDWPGWQALAVIFLIAGQGMMLFAITAATSHFLLMLAAGMLIPACRRLEANGDVQAILNYALTLPLLLLAGPPLAVLLPLLVLAVPFREHEARHKNGIFGAMLLVAAVPIVITSVGVAVIAVRAGLDLGTIVAPFASVFHRRQQPLIPAILLIATTAPVIVALLAHLFIPDRRRKVFTTTVALLLPTYLAIGNSFFGWDLPNWLPAATMLATVLGWLSSTRVRPRLRLIVIGLLLVGFSSSWMFLPVWAESEWAEGLWPVRLFGYQLG